MSGFAGVSDATLRKIAVDATRLRVARDHEGALFAAATVCFALTYDLGVPEERVPTPNEIVSVLEVEL